MDGMKEKKSGNAIKFIIPAAVGIALVLLLLGVAFLTGNIGKNPSKTLAEAVDKTFTPSEDALKEIWQMDEYKDMFEDGQMHIDADIDLSGLGSMEIQLNKDGERCGMLIGVGYYGVSLLEANLYMDDDEMRLGAPDLTDYVLYVDFATIDEDIETFIENNDIDYFAADELRTLCEEMQGRHAADDAAENGTMEEAYEQLEDALRRMASKAKVEKADDKKLTVSGSQRSCQGYVVTIDDAKIVEFLSTYKEIYESNEAFQSYVDQLMTASLGYEADHDLVLEALDLLSDACTKEGDLQVYFYIYDGVIAQISFESGEMFFEWNIDGGSFPLENMDLTFAYDLERFVIKRSGSLDGSDYEAEYRIEKDGEELIFAVELDKESGDFRFEFEEEYYFDILLKGKIEKTVPGSECEITIDTFKVDDEEILYGDIIISNECGEIEVPEGDLKNVLTMTEDDWYDILWDLSYFLY